MSLLNTKALKYLMLFLFLGNFTTCLFSQDAQLPEVGMIKSLSGNVWLSRDGKKEPAKKAMELKKGDTLEIEEHASITIVYFEGGRKEEYKSSAVLEIGVDKSAVREGGAAVVQELEKKKIIMDRQEAPKSHDRDIAHAGGQFIRGIPAPKQYFENNHIQRYAVVVGISDYKDPKIPDLKYADADAQAFYDFITGPTGGAFNKENVLLLKNEQATMRNVKMAVTGFLKKAIDTDFVTIFIACHGEPEPDRPGNIYLLMHDSELDSLSATAYHMENVNADMKRYISAKRLIFFADACHSGGLSGSVGTRGFSNTINIALSELKSTREGWGIVSASRAGEVSMESDQWGGGHGVFTYYLLEGMKGGADVEGNKNGIVTLAEAFDFLSDKVKRATRSAQHPDTAGNFDNNLPIGFPGVETSSGEGEQDTSLPRFGTLRISTSPEGATACVSDKEVGTTPLEIKLVSGTYPVTVRKRGGADMADTAFVNPGETTDLHFAMSDGERRKASKPEPIFTTETVEGYAESAHVGEDRQKIKENVDSLIKELEAMAKEQEVKEEKPKVVKKLKKKQPEPVVETSATVPISIKEFNVKMGALSNRRDMERLRQRIIDALLNQKGLSVVERDLEFQEEILREQRLSGSVLADEMYRIGLGKIRGAAFLCFGGVASGDTSDEFVLRVEIVDTATTLIDTIECVFGSDENQRLVADNVAGKIREKISAKRKL